MVERASQLGDACQVRGVHPAAVARARRGLAGDATYRRLVDLFGALADVTRAKIVHALLRQDLCTCDLAATIGVSESAISQHLRLLRTLRVVKSRRSGKFVYYSLDDAHIAMLIQLGLTHQGHDGSADPGSAPAESATTGGRS